MVTICCTCPECFGTGTALTELHRSREALLAFLAAAIEPARAEAQHDRLRRGGSTAGIAARRFAYEGITVRFAREPGNADAMLEDLIADHKSPADTGRRVGRPSRAAGRAAAAGQGGRQRSLVGRVVCRTAATREAESPQLPQKPTAVNLSEGEVDYWVRQFADAPQEEPPKKSPRKSSQAKSKQDTQEDFDNPFPPGYGEDLLDGE